MRSIGKKCTLYDKLEDGNVKCHGCFHKCILQKGPLRNGDPDKEDPRSTIGICGIRHNYEGDLYLLDHSRPTTICVDHIEKTPFFHFYPGEPVFTVGTTGCNFRCSFCQNWRVSQLPQEILRKRNTKKHYLKDIEDSILFLDACSMSPHDTVEEARKRYCKIIEYNGYNEPTIMFDDFVLETCKIARKFGIKNVMCSNAYQSVESIEMIAPYIDAVSIGLKSIRNSFYSKYCGARIKPILRNIKKFAEYDHIFVEVQTLIIPGINDSNEEISELATFLFNIHPEIVLHLSRFEKEYKFLENDSLPRSTSDEDLLRCYKIAKQSGLKNVYVDIEKLPFFQTKCESCDHLLVERGVFTPGKIVGIKDDESRCANCDHELYGIWSDTQQRQVIINKQKLKFDNEDTSQSTQIHHIHERKNIKNKKNEVLLLFGSQTGVSEEITYKMKEVGDSIIKESEKSGDEEWSILAIDLEDFDASEVFKNSFLVFIISTYFYGHPPRNATKFYHDIMSMKDEEEKEEEEAEGENEENEKTNLRYCVFGIGSTGTLKCHLETYQVAARRLDRKMMELGGTRMQDIVEWNKKNLFEESVGTETLKFWQNFVNQYVQ